MGQLSRIPLLAGWRWWLAWSLLAWSGAVHAQAPSAGAPLERQVKAAYLYKFASFVEWPEASFARPDSPLQIGVAGNEALAELLEKMVAARSVNGHPLKVRRIAPGEPLDELHILFVDGALERGAISTLLDAAQGRSLLTVSDAAGDIPGCMITFVIADDKLRFDVTLKHVAPSKLRISARMLAVAHKVRAAS
jgi:hypothetical protein